MTKNTGGLWSLQVGSTSWKTRIQIPDANLDYDHHRPYLFASDTEKDSGNIMARAVLSIDRVSEHDLSTNFTCLGKNSYDKISKTVTLVQRG